MNTRRDLTRLARFMSRWLKEHGHDEWIVVAQVERIRAYSKWFKTGEAYRRGRLWLKDRVTMRKRLRLLVHGDVVKGEENAGESLLLQCWKTLGAKSVEEVALRWTLLGDDVVLNWFNGKRSWLQKIEELKP